MDGKLMAGETPKTRAYAQPRTTMTGKIVRDDDAAIGIGDRNLFLGPLDQGFMGRSPREYGLYVPNPDVTPQANPAAVRAYTRNAPYMEEFMSDPQAMYKEIHRLRVNLVENPDDVVSQYRLRVMQSALGDVFGMQIPGGYTDLYGRAQAPVTPSDTWEGGRTPTSRPMVENMAKRGR